MCSLISKASPESFHPLWAVWTCFSKLLHNMLMMMRNIIFARYILEAAQSTERDEDDSIQHRRSHLVASTWFLIFSFMSSSLCIVWMLIKPSSAPAQSRRRKLDDKHKRTFSLLLVGPFPSFFAKKKEQNASKVHKRINRWYSDDYVCFLVFHFSFFRRKQLFGCLQ